MSKVTWSFLEASIPRPSLDVGTKLLPKFQSQIQWATSFGNDVFLPQHTAELQRLKADAQALEFVHKAQVLCQEAQQRTRDPSGEISGRTSRSATVIVAEALDLLRARKNHSQVAFSLCSALLSMVEVCGEEFKEEMDKKGLGVLASFVADVWAEKPEVARRALKLLGIMSLSLLMVTAREHLRNNPKGQMVCLCLETLNRLCQQNSKVMDEVARLGGRELLEDVEASGAAANCMVMLHVFTLRRRIRGSKVKSCRPRLQVTLPPEDVVRIRELFEKLDDGTGHINTEGLASAFRFLGLKPSHRELREAIAEVNPDGTGCLEWPEFLFLMSRYEGGSKSIEKKFTSERLEQLRAVFNLFDEDGSQDLDVKELGLIMRSVGLSPTDFEIQAMINTVDATGSGTISWPEFLYLMSKKVARPDEQHQHAFEFFDKDRTKRVQKSDFIAQMQLLSSDFKKDELEDMFAEAKFEDEDIESLTYKEFVKMMMR